MERSPPNYVKLATTNAAAAAAQQRNERVVLTATGELNYPGQGKWSPKPPGPSMTSGGQPNKSAAATKIITVGIDGNLRSTVMADSKDFQYNIGTVQGSRAYGSEQMDWTSSGNRNAPASTSFKNEQRIQSTNQWISNTSQNQQHTLPYVKVVSINSSAGGGNLSTANVSRSYTQHSTSSSVSQQFWSPSHPSNYSETDSDAGDTSVASPRPGGNAFGHSNVTTVMPASQGFIRSRKPCNCTKSMCLKLYCDCFANGELCKNCNCQNCHNSLEFERDRTRAVKACLDRNPLAFHPKIGATENKDDIDRQHKKGCHCKKSGCLKNYCECYEAKITCTWRCKCICCQNNDMRRHLRRKQPQTALSTLAITESDRDLRIGRNTRSPLRTDSEEERNDSPFSSALDPPRGQRLPVWCLTDDVVEATALCLLAAAENLEGKENGSDAFTERTILEEFGRCLHQIVESATL